MVVLHAPLTLAGFPGGVAQAEKEKQVTFQTQLRQQARQLIEDNTNDDNETQAMLENLKSESEARIASEAQELEDQ